jgi:hypothetical protein
MAESRHTKLRKLNAFRRSMPHVTASAMSQILKGIVDEGMPDLRSRNQMREATQGLMNEVTPHGPLLVELPLRKLDGTDHTDWAVNPMAFLFHAYRNDGSFRTLLDETVVREEMSADKPLRLVVYADEIVPGKELSHNNKRKQWAMYWSFGQFLPYFHLEETWMPILSIRSSTVSDIDAGISQVMAAALKLFFGALQTDMSTGGCVLVGADGTQLRIFADLWMVLQDGGAHKLLWHCKGDAGTKMCMLCKELLAEDSGEKDDDDVPIIVCKEISVDNLDFATDDDIRGTVDRLAARHGTMGVGQYNLLQQAVGFNNEPFGILRDESLRRIVKPASQYCHDWMHAVMVGGVMNVVMFLLLASLAAAGMNDIYNTLHGYCDRWHWPKFRSHGTAVRDLFLKKRETANNKAKTFKALASELLSLYPLLAVFVTRVVLERAGICKLECIAFLALCDLIDMLQVANLGKCSPDQLMHAVRVFLESCTNAGWQSHFIPKFHWLVHLPRHLQTFGCLPTCWVHERKHRVVKRYATDIQNDRTMERSVLGEVVSHNLRDINRLNLFNLSPGLVEPVEANSRIVEFLRNCLDASIQPDDVKKGFKARIIPAGYCCRTDVALVRSDDGVNFMAGDVWLHVEVRGEPLSLVNIWAPGTYDRNGGVADWTKRHNPTFVHTRDILASVMSSDLGGNGVRTLIPWLYRRYKPVDS